MTEFPTEEDFRSCLGDTFVLHREASAAVTLRLAEVTPSGERGDDTPVGIRRNPFSLLFRGDPGLSLSQATYRVEHERLGAHAIFLVPLQPDAEGTSFEAVFG